MAQGITKTRRGADVLALKALISTDLCLGDETSKGCILDPSLTIDTRMLKAEFVFDGLLHSVRSTICSKTNNNSDEPREVGKSGGGRA